MDKTMIIAIAAQALFVLLYAAIDAAGGILNGADAIAEVLKAAFPRNPIIHIADKVIDYAKIGVRKVEARRFSEYALETAGIAQTP